MGSDKNGNILWVGNSWGGTLAKIDIHTMATSFVPLPGPGVMQPYHVAVDRGHNAWLNLWTSDAIMRFDPASNKWTTFDLPTRGTEARYISLLERDGKMEVVLPYSRTSKVAVMPFRGAADLQALKDGPGHKAGPGADAAAIHSDEHPPPLAAASGGEFFQARARARMTSTRPFTSTPPSCRKITGSLLSKARSLSRASL